MVFQITNCETNETLAYHDALSLRSCVFNITNDLNTANDVMEWANNPVNGGIRYDGEKFFIMLYNYGD